MAGELFVSIYWFIACSFLFVLGVIVFLAFLSFLKEKLINAFGSELGHTDERVRRAYVMKLDDEDMLKNVALNDSSEDVAVWAVERIRSRSALEEISRSDRGIVSEVAKRKADNL
ncbi:hypothetical protein [Methanobrevibacter sp.]|uniref:hypothetical protein n=1 Tax=Methanobrevibacter sp. TaxID=66852 RepID=UPI00388D57B5